MEDQNIEGKDRETSALSKKSLRQHIRQRKARHTDEELVVLSQPIVEAVLADPRFQEAQTVLLYHSLPDEVYTPGLIAAALRMGKRVLLPVVISRTEMEIREYLPTTEMALSDDFHILEPPGRRLHRLRLRRLCHHPRHGLRRPGPPPRARPWLL